MVASRDMEPSAAPATDLPTIRGFMPSTLIDWPGRIAAILFLPYCNLRCPYCHAGHLLEPQSDEVIPFEQIRDYLREKESWLDGVVICGGEPTVHAALPRLCREIHALGLAVKLDTNGTLPEVIAALITDGLVDAVSMDLKTTLDHRMVELARADVDLAAIDRTVTMLLDAAAGSAGAQHAVPAKIEVEFRTTCCPAFVDAEVVDWIAHRIRPVESKPAVDYVLQRFEPEHSLDPAVREVVPYSAAEMEELLTVARRWNPTARLRSG